MVQPNGELLFALLRAVSRRRTSKAALARAYDAFCRHFLPERDVGLIESVLFEKPRLSPSAKRALIHLLGVAANDDAWNVLVRIVRDENETPEFKNHAARILLSINADAAWKIIGINGPSWLNPLALAGASKPGDVNGPGLAGGLPNELFKQVALGTGEPVYGKQPETEDA